MSSVRILALDWGERRTGVAISDDRGRLAVGYGIWPTSELLPNLARVVREEHIALIVVGYPLTARGEVGRKAREVDRVIARLQRAGYTVRRWDERLTTHEAARTLSGLGISQKRQRGRLDMAAAVLLLQSYLDANPSEEEDPRGR